METVKNVCCKFSPNVGASANQKELIIFKSWWLGSEIRDPEDTRHGAGSWNQGVKKNMIPYLGAGSATLTNTLVILHYAGLWSSALQHIAGLDPRYAA
jgi:hypothetical protein